MTKRNDVYKCNICGAMHQALHDGAGDPVCCEKAMTRIKDNFNDNVALEKHVPLVKRLDERTVQVSIGEVIHPMTDEHFIEWIELREGDSSLRKFLKPGDNPVINFNVSSDAYEVRAYCNQHGLWRA